jgi:hypothetical protein
MKAPEPVEEHGWLQQLLGNWTWEHDAPAQEGKPAATYRGTETVRSIDGLWFIAEGQGDFGEAGNVTNVMTLGFDPARQRYVGTFIGSMMTNLWVYEGEVDKSRNSLVLHTEGPSFTDPAARAQYRDELTIVDRDYRTLTSGYVDDAGKLVVFMTAHYRRVAT